MALRTIIRTACPECGAKTGELRDGRLWWTPNNCTCPKPPGPPDVPRPMPFGSCRLILNYKGEDGKEWPTRVCPKCHLAYAVNPPLSVDTRCPNCVQNRAKAASLDPNRPFPIQSEMLGSDANGAAVRSKEFTIPWWMAELAYEGYCASFGSDTSQTLQELASRRGFGAFELLTFLTGTWDAAVAERFKERVKANLKKA